MLVFGNKEVFLYSASTQTSAFPVSPYQDRMKVLDVLLTIQNDRKIEHSFWYCYLKVASPDFSSSNLARKVSLPDIIGT